MTRKPNRTANASISRSPPVVRFIDEPPHECKKKGVSINSRLGMGSYDALEERIIENLVIVRRFRHVTVSFTLLPFLTKLFPTLFHFSLASFELRALFRCQDRENLCTNRFVLCLHLPT